MPDFSHIDFAQALKDSLKECLEYEKGDTTLRTFHSLSLPRIPCFSGKDIQGIRNSLEFSESMFAQLFGVNTNTIKRWESGESNPNGPSRRLLAIIKSNPSDFISDILPTMGVQSNE